MFEFRCFGSGSSGNCYYIGTEDGGFLIDVGIGIRLIKKYFKEYGINQAKLRGIFVTHDHADHIKAVGVLANELKIPVFATENVHLGIRKNPGICKKPNDELVHFIQKSQTIKFCGCNITAFNVPHDSTDNVGYSVTYENRSFCLITDAGHINENMEQYIHNANYLVLEANYDELMLKNGPYPEYLKLRISSDNGHLCNNAAAEALLKNGSDKLKKIWLCHLSEENNHPELARKTIETMLTNNGFFEGKEVSIEVLKRKVPSELYSL